ncbi:MAG: hypothetical protein CVV52_02165, partial [Spirochaetae bacterium HGW-Spirochaetae-8]
MPIRRTLGFLLALCFCGSVLPAGALPIRLEIASAQISSGDAQVDTTLYKAVEIGLIDVLDWRFIIDDKSDTVFEAIIENPVSDTRLFPGQRYLSFGLRLKWNGMEIEQRFAILGKSLKELETKISQAVRDQLRYDLLAVVVPPSSVWTLQYIDGSDFSLLADPGTTKIGERHILTDYHGKVIGLASVADILPIEDHESEHAIEFNLIQADRRPEPGMLVIPKTSQWNYTLGPVVSLSDFGVEVEANAPLASNNAFFSLKSGVWWPYTVFSTPDAMELTLRAGIGARMGLATITGQPDRWFSNLEVGLDARIGLGLQMKTSGTSLFLYGAEIELLIKH